MGHPSRMTIRYTCKKSIIMLLPNLALYLFLFLATPDATPVPVMEAPMERPVLLELFTSQGCSSCPPADRVLSRLNEEAKAGDLSVIALSFHVDYWNRLGWTDPYSDAAYSQRQRIYARKLGDNRVYTPELVVDGRTGHVGSREGEVRQAIKSASARQQVLPVDISVMPSGKNTLALTYTLGQVPGGTHLQVALVDPMVNNEVPRGENRGRHLEHVQVVRSFQTIESPKKSGTVALDLSTLDYPEQGQVVVFLQDAETWVVEGVALLKTPGM